MNKIEKNKILKIVSECAIKYKENLANKNILFIYYEKNDLKYIETKFLPSNFLHLTGLQYKRKQNNNAIKFYQDVLDKKVSLENIEIKDKKIVGLKLSVLTMLMNINRNAKMLGEYDSSTKKLLLTEMVIGTSVYSAGFIKIGKYYIPNSSLREDIRNITLENSKIIGIFSKEIQTQKYCNIANLAKKAKLEVILKNNELLSKIDTKNLNLNNNPNKQ